MHGKRVADNEHPVNPGEYSKITDHKPGLWWPGKPYWMVCAPNGLLGNLLNHKCIEETDGTLTVPPPAPGEGANSILIQQYDGKSWHGFIDHGVWRHC